MSASPPEGLAVHELLATHLSALYDLHEPPHAVCSRLPPPPPNKDPSRLSTAHDARLGTLLLPFHPFPFLPLDYLVRALPLGGGRVPLADEGAEVGHVRRLEGDGCGRSTESHCSYARQVEAAEWGASVWTNKRKHSRLLSQTVRAHPAGRDAKYARMQVRVPYKRVTLEPASTCASSPPPRLTPRLLPTLLLPRIYAVEEVALLEVAVLASVSEGVFEAGLGGDEAARERSGSVSASLVSHTSARGRKKPSKIRMSKYQRIRPLAIAERERTKGRAGLTSSNPACSSRACSASRVYRLPTTPRRLQVRPPSCAWVRRRREARVSKELVRVLERRRQKGRRAWRR